MVSCREGTPSLGALRGRHWGHGRKVLVHTTDGVQGQGCGQAQQHQHISISTNSISISIISDSGSILQERIPISDVRPYASRNNRHKGVARGSGKYVKIGVEYCYRHCRFSVGVVGRSASFARQMRMSCAVVSFPPCFNLHRK